MNKPISIEIQEPKLTRFLFANTRMGWVWLVLRLYVGYEWLMAGWETLKSPVWVGAKAGTAIQGFLGGALQKMAGPHPDVSGWYGYFVSNIAMHHAVLLSYLVAYGESAVGLGLILGAFTGIAAFFGAFMNLNYLFAGTVSVNPFLLFIQLFLILAWRNAGWLGLDRWLLPWLGAPWQPGKAFTGGKHEG
jgi:thiosulfate dehydrogenase [quinone] large subunit